MTGHAVVAEARTWIGTLYRHGAGEKGLGCDCLGLVLGAVRLAAPGLAVPPAPAYAPDWAEAARDEVLLDGLARALPLLWRRALGTAAPPEPEAGHLLLIRWREGRPASHLAIATGAGTIVHAHAGAAVAEVAWTAAFARRLAAIFTLPEGS
jgi:NlpC/P60 family putative phage cell wall peptidase